MGSAVESTMTVEPNDEGCTKSPKRLPVQETQDEKEGGIGSDGEECRVSEGREGTTSSEKIEISSDVGSQEEEGLANGKLISSNQA
jgi:hypothetical protein